MRERFVKTIVLSALAVAVLCVTAGSADAAYRYDRAGSYLDYASRPHTLHWPSLSGAERQVDSEGVLLTLTDGTQIRSAVEDAIYGLVEFSKWREGGPRRFLGRAKRAAVWLTNKQDELGLFHYDYDFNLGLPERPLWLRSGWYGALGQSLSASLGARLYRLTGNPYYRRLARTSIEAFSRPINQGGVQSRFLGSDLPFFEGYGTLATPVHTLDHHMYALMGLYDTADLFPASGPLFRGGLRSLIAGLPRYDVIGPDGRPRTTSWLGHVTDPPRPAYVLLGNQQEQEVAILRALVSIRPGQGTLARYLRRYSRQLTWICGPPVELCQFEH